MTADLDRHTPTTTGTEPLDATFLGSRLQNLQRRHLRRLEQVPCDLNGRPFADVHQRRPRRAVFREQVADAAFVAADPDLRIGRNLAQKRQTELLRLGLRSAAAEDLSRHVLDHAEHRDLHLAKHGDRLHRVEQRHLLRGAHDNRPGNLHRL